MKAKLTFDLTNGDDIVEFRRANKSNDMANAILEFKNHTESQIKNLDLSKFDQQETIDFIFDTFDNILKSHNINIDEIMF